MVRAAFFGDVFIPQQRSVKAEVKMKSKEYQAVQYALLDSGSTHSFISPHLINRYQIPRIKINRPKPIRNIDGSRNSIGMVTHEVKLEIQYGAYKGLHTFYEINLEYNPRIPLPRSYQSTNRLEERSILRTHYHIHSRCTSVDTSQSNAHT